MSAFWVIAAAVTASMAVAMLVPGRPSLDRAARPDEIGGPSPSTIRSSVLGGAETAMPIRRRLRWSALAGLSVTVGLQAWWGWASILAGLAGFAAAASVLGWVEPAGAKRRRWLATVQAPQVLDLLAAGLQAGLPLRAVVAGVVGASSGPIIDDLRRVMDLVALGTSDAEAWRSLAEHPQLAAVALDLSRSVDSGTRLAEALAVHAAEARQLRRAALEVEARKVGVRSVLPLMICFVPAFLLLGVVPTVASALLRGFAALT